MLVLMLFGLPGTGKTFIGKVLRDDFGYFFYDGDNDLPQEMRIALDAHVPITNAMRDIFFLNIVKRIKQLKRKHKKLVVAQTCIKEKYRIFIAKKIPEIQFFLIHTDTALREERLLQRKDYPLDITYARKMCAIFEKPKINHSILTNNTDDTTSIKKQVKEILGGY